MRQLPALIGMILYLSVSIACSINIGSKSISLINTNYLNRKMDSKPIDLSRDAKCPTPMALRVKSVETRSDDYTICESGGRTFYIVPSKLSETIAKYIEEKLVEGNANVSVNNGKEIQVSIQEVKEIDGGALCAIVKLKITIPEIKYTQIYSSNDFSSGDDCSAMGDNALAYAVYHAVQHFLEDAVVQHYIKCGK